MKCWDASEEIEVENASIIYDNPYGDAWTENTFPEGDGQYSIPYITFSSGCTISGTITLNGGPGNVTDVLVTAGDISVNPDAGGYYEIGPLDPGTYDVTASLDAYYPEIESAEVIAGEVTTIDFTLNPEIGNISGTVIDELSSEPLEGVLISIGDYEIWTTADGTYFLSDILIGTYDVTASIDNYYPETISGVEIIVDQTTIVDFELMPEPGIIDGVVYDNHTGDVIEGALVEVEGTILTATTGADGYYIIENITIGVYNVIAMAENYENETVMDVEVFSNQTTPVDFYLVPEPGGLEGTVIDEFTLSPIEGALITLDGTAYSAYTNSDGYYFVENIFVGEYTVIATADNYFESTVYDIEIFSNQVTTLDFELYPQPGSIDGYIIDVFTGDPIEGAEINVEDTYWAYTNEEGYYLIEEVEVGTYSLLAEADGYYPEERTTTVISNQTTEENFELYHIFQLNFSTYLFLEYIHYYLYILGYKKYGEEY